MLTHWKHLSLDDRKMIGNMIGHDAKAKTIAVILKMDPTAISKEVKRNRTQLSKLTKDSGVCPRTERWPFVCDNCPKKYGQSCKLTKWVYKPLLANDLANYNLRETRKGIDMNPTDFAKADAAIKEGVTKGVSLYEIAKTEGMPSLSTAYRWIEEGRVQTRRIDLPMAVKCKKRVKKAYEYGGSSKGKEGRGYLDYLAYRRLNPGLFGWQMDFLGAIVSDRWNILTLTIPELSFSIIKKVKKGDSKAAKFIIDSFEEKLGLKAFKELFPFILTDNDPCLSDYMELEFSKATGERRLLMFYCDPYVSNQKGSVENTNGQLRRYFPKGMSVGDLSDSFIRDINVRLLTRRLRSLGGETPRDTFIRLYGEDSLDKLLEF
jgi:transposase, IS30 family